MTIDEMRELYEKRTGIPARALRKARGCDAIEAGADPRDLMPVEAVKYRAAARAHLTLRVDANGRERWSAAYYHWAGRGEGRSPAQAMRKAAEDYAANAAAAAEAAELFGSRVAGDHPQPDTFRILTTAS